MGARVTGGPTGGQIMYPIWIMVDPASAFWMSSWRRLMIAPNSRVAARTIGRASRASALRFEQRAGPDDSGRTPRVTWWRWMSARQGVGPSIESRRQD